MTKLLKLLALQTKEKYGYAAMDVEPLVYRCTLCGAASHGVEWHDKEGLNDR